MCHNQLFEYPNFFTLRNVILPITSQAIFVLCVLHGGDYFGRKFLKTILNTEHKTVLL
jgi:hypothetical protein